MLFTLPSFLAPMAASTVLAVIVPKAEGGDDDSIRVGEVDSRTGVEEEFGQHTHRGITLAIDQINAAGGIKGRPLRDLSLDDEGGADLASAEADRLANQDRVVAIIGETSSSISITMAPIAQSAHVPMISPASTNERVTQIGDYVFRSCFIDPFQGHVMAKFARTDLGFKRVAILRDIGSDYSTGLAGQFARTFQSLGGTVAVDVDYHKGDVDFAAQIAKLKDAHAEAIFVPGYYTDVAVIAKQARKDGLEVPFLGGDGWASQRLFDVAGESLEGSYFSDHYSAEDTSPRVTAFVKAYKRKFDGEVPDSEAAMGYDAVELLADALRRAPDQSGPAVRDALAATHNLDAVTGPITIDEHRNALKPAIIKQVQKHRRFVFVKRVAP